MPRAEHEIRVPSALLNAEGTTPAERWVWVAIRSRQGNGPWCLASHETLADDVGSERSRVSKTIAKLRRLGWLETDGRKIRCTTPDNCGESPQYDSPQQPENGGDSPQLEGDEMWRTATADVANCHTECGDSPQPSKSQTLKPNIKTEEEEVADARTREGPLAFLREGDRVYLATILEALDRHDPSSVGKLIVGRWGREMRGGVPHEDVQRIVSEQMARHADGFQRVVAAVVITGDKARAPNLAYLQSTLDGFERDQNRERYAQRAAGLQSGHGPVRHADTAGAGREHPPASGHRAEPGRRTASERAGAVSYRGLTREQAEYEWDRYGHTALWEHLPDGHPGRAAGAERHARSGAADDRAA